MDRSMDTKFLVLNLVVLVHVSLISYVLTIILNLVSLIVSNMEAGRPKGVPNQ
jgi:hypothetical protein